MHLITFFVVLKINGNSEKMSKGVDRRSIEHKFVILSQK
jgi:hypothetical protein